MSNPEENLRRRRLANLKFHEDFVEDTYAQVKNLELPPIPEKTDYVAVLIEPRPHKHLEYVIRNIRHFLGPGWGLYIVGSRSNREVLLKIVEGMTNAQLEFLDVDNLSREEFRDLRKSFSYWHRLPGKKLLCFETDTLLCRSGVFEFTDYDWVGAPWKKGFAISDVVRVGNGGLSIRSRQAMMDMCARGKPRVIPSEDSYFSLHLHLHKDEYKIPSVDVAKQFSVETLYYPTPLGIHKPWLYLTRSELMSIYDTIKY